MPKDTFYRLRDDKQACVMRAAIRVFLENGFARAKIGDIARSAGVAKGSLYQYFEDKKELFIYCAEWSLKQFMKKLDERMNIGGMDVFSYFEDNLARAEVIDEERELVLFMQLIAREPGLIDDSMRAMYNVGDAYIKRLVQNGKDAGTVRADIDDDLLMEYFIAVTERFKLRWMERYVDFRTEPTDAQRRAMDGELNQMLALLKNGMGC